MHSHLSLTLLSIFSVFPLLASSQTFDSRDGAFILNEGWYGHENGYLNYFDGKDWTYHAFAKVNEGHELGCTAEYATIADGRIYITSKQAQDKGSSIAGARLTIADAKTLKMIAQKQTLENSADPRAVAATNKYLYVSTHDGILVYDITTLNSVKTISEREYGTLVTAANRLFAVPQTGGIVVINTADNTIETTISNPAAYDFSTIVEAHDGKLYANSSTYNSSKWSYYSEPALLQIDPVSLETQTIQLGDFCSSLPSAWSGWCAGGFVASPVSNRLYWKENAGWGTSLKLYYFDLDTQEGGILADFSDNATYGFYEGALAVNPRTGAIHAAMAEANYGPGVAYRIIEADGTISHDETLSTDYTYAFPALVFFPETTDVDGIAINRIPNTFSDNAFDLSGRPVSANSHSLIIRNGKKTIQ